MVKIAFSINLKILQENNFLILINCAEKIYIIQFFGILVTLSRIISDGIFFGRNEIENTKL